MNAAHKKIKWFERWDLNEKGSCKHIRDILKDAEPIGVIELDKDQRWEIFSCKVCGCIYCGRVPLKYFLEKASRA